MVIPCDSVNFLNNAAKHCAFGEDFAKIPMQELKQRQRGQRRQKAAKVGNADSSQDIESDASCTPSKEQPEPESSPQKEHVGTQGLVESPLASSTECNSALCTKEPGTPNSGSQIAEGSVHSNINDEVRVMRMRLTNISHGSLK